MVIKSLFLAAATCSSFIHAVEPSQQVVIKLDSIDEFEKALETNRYVLIKWYAPWCSHCKAMAEDYKTAATELHKLQLEKQLNLKENESLLLAEVDATELGDLSQKYNVQGYPTLQWFVNGIRKTEYGGGRAVEDVVKFVQSNIGPSLKTVTTEELDTMLKDRKSGHAVIAISGKADDIKYKIAATSVADLPMIAAHVVFIETQSDNKLVIYKGTDEKVEISQKEVLDLYNSKELDEWIKKERKPLFGQINEDNFELYMEFAVKGLFWVCFDSKTMNEDVKKYSGMLVEAAKKKEYPFVWIDVDEFEEQAKQELKCTTYPTIVLQRGDLVGENKEEPDAQVEKFVRSFSDDPSKFTTAAVEKFFTDIESGTLQKSEEPDELDAMDSDEGEGEESEL